MLTARAGTPAFAMVWVALAAAMLLVTPREFDRIRTARAGAYRPDCHEAPHGIPEDYVPDSAADRGDGESPGDEHAIDPTIAIVQSVARWAPPAFRSVPPAGARVLTPSPRPWSRPPGRAPPAHA